MCMGTMERKWLACKKKTPAKTPRRQNNRLAFAKIWCLHHLYRNKQWYECALCVILVEENASWILYILLGVNMSGTYNLISLSSKRKQHEIIHAHAHTAFWRIAYVGLCGSTILYFRSDIDRRIKLCTQLVWLHQRFGWQKLLYCCK